MLLCPHCDDGQHSVTHKQACAVLLSFVNLYLWYIRALENISHANCFSLARGGKPGYKVLCSFTATLPLNYVNTFKKKTVPVGWNDELNCPRLPLSWTYESNWPGQLDLHHFDFLSLGAAGARTTNATCNVPSSSLFSFFFLNTFLYGVSFHLWSHKKKKSKKKRERTRTRINIPFSFRWLSREFTHIVPLFFLRQEKKKCPFWRTPREIKLQVPKAIDLPTFQILLDC